ncbi:MAG: CdaR family protein [Lachnospiraceae bacterium]|nr:CdaR family protein [Lachnospiraceae bacterium]
MKKWITNNLGLKILALLVSVGLWIIAININDPVSENTYTVNVSLQNAGVLSSAGKYFEVKDNSDRIKVVVRGTRTALSQFNQADIVATADLSKITEDNLVPIDLSTTKQSDKIEGIRSDSQYVKLALEDVRRLQMPIEVKVLNDPQDGYILGSTQTSQNVVIISGPESIINQVESAAVEIDVSGATTDVKISLPIHLYSKEDDIIDTTKVNMSVQEISTTASILQKAVVPLIAIPQGTPTQGYVLNGIIEGLPTEITIAGKSNIVSKIPYIDISESLDVNDIYQNTSYEININDYLPDGVSMVGNVGNNGILDISVGVDKESERTIVLDPEAIQVIGVPEGYSATVSDLEDDVEVPVSGLKSLLDTVDESKLVPVINVDKYLSNNGLTIEKGHIDIPLDITLPDNVRLSREVKVRITITEE